MWFDQYENDYTGKEWLSIKDHVKSLQPRCLVIANNSEDYQDTALHGYEYGRRKARGRQALPKEGNTNPLEGVRHHRQRLVLDIEGARGKYGQCGRGGSHARGVQQPERQLPAQCGARPLRPDPRLGRHPPAGDRSVAGIKMSISRTILCSKNRGPAPLTGRRSCLAIAVGPGNQAS